MTATNATVLALSDHLHTALISLLSTNDHACYDQTSSWTAQRAGSI